MKKKTLIIAAAAILLTVIIVASARSRGPKGEKVYLAPAATRPIESVVTASGQIDPKVKVNISAHVIGKIDKPKKKYVFLVGKNKAQLPRSRPVSVTLRTWRSSQESRPAIR